MTTFISTQTPAPFETKAKFNSGKIVKYTLAGCLFVSLFFNAATTTTILQQQEEIVQQQEEIVMLRKEVATLQAYKDSCGFNGVKKMFNEYVGEPVTRAYQAVKAKVGD